jgi:hypothetical protein
MLDLGFLGLSDLGQQAQRGLRLLLVDLLERVAGVNEQVIVHLRLGQENQADLPRYAAELDDPSLTFRFDQARRYG